MVLSFFGAVVFSLKSLFYRLIGKKDLLENEQALKANQNNIVIFNEGKMYWNTFRPIVEALLKKKAIFSYYTMDIHDPCLRMDEPNMNNCYIGNGTRAFAKISNLKADVVISTTPNIGTEGYPIARSKSIKKLVHVFHIFGDLSTYHRGSLDNYDAVMLVGEFEKPIIRKLENLRGLPPKELYEAGLPYLDVLEEKKNCAPERVEVSSDVKTILIAPSWGKKSCLYQYGSRFISLLAKERFHIIIRPHPQSLKVEPDLLEKIKSELDSFKNVEWDFEIDASESMQRANILISDTSGIRIDFILLYQKPIITLEIPSENMTDFELTDLGESWTNQKLRQLGHTLGKDNIEELPKIVHETLITKASEEIIAFRDNNVYNYKRSGEVIAKYLIENGRHLKQSS
ncbi:MAG: CDP-glycerol glycerophosphotransferase family protein [Selenomonadaceae bacterium]|nr:CDP-glycerol glycerophosphotransferase family protein [Selenomonadaceae bacterium]